MLPSSVFSPREWAGENTHDFLGDPDGVRKAQPRTRPSAGKYLAGKNLNVITTENKAFSKSKCLTNSPRHGGESF